MIRHLVFSGYQAENRYIRLKLTNVVIGLVISVFGTSALAQRPKIDLACKHIAPIEQSYLTRHITFDRANRNLESRVIEQYIKKLDPTKIYLLNSDVKSIKKMTAGILEKKKERDCSSIKKAHELFEKRVSERVDYAKKALGPKFKFDKKTKLNLDSESRKYAKNLDEANRFHNKYIQFQVSNYLATDVKLDEAKQNVTRNYERVLRRVKDLDEEDVWSLYLDAFAHSLDPHSSYLSADALEDFEIQMRLSLEGIGATLSFRDGFTVIEQLIPGGAAASSGKLKPKDKIIAVGEGDSGKMTNVIEEDLRDVVRLIRGKKGTTVQLTILRKTGKETKRFNVSLVRDRIKLEDEAAAVSYLDKTINTEYHDVFKDVEGDKKKIKLALLNLPSFYADSRRNGRSAAKDVKKLLKEAKDKNADAIVLDLSTNGGGSLDDAVKIAGLFFRTGNVVKQSSRDPSNPEMALADEDPMVDWDGPLVVLTSRISASASEIVAGTLQDYQRAVIVGGDHTFGKGSVQSVEPLPPGLGALKTTVGMFFTAGGSSTQHRGVDSDIGFPSAYSNDDIGEKNLDYSLPPKKITPFLSSTAYVDNGPGGWRKITSNTIAWLNAKSQTRIKKNKDFDKIREAIVKNEKRGKIITVGEVLEEKDNNGKLADGKVKGADSGDELVDDESNDYTLSREERMKKYLERADVQEALNIATDLVVAQKKPSIVIGAKHVEKKSKNN